MKVNSRSTSAECLVGMGQNRAHGVSSDTVLLFSDTKVYLCSFKRCRTGFKLTPTHQLFSETHILTGLCLAREFSSCERVA